MDSDVRSDRGAAHPRARRRSIAVPPAVRGAEPFARVVLANLARAMLMVVLTLLICAVVPMAFGWRTTTVMSGSMTPRIHPGDVVVTAPAGAARLRAGQVLLVRDPDHPGELRLHRFVGVDDRGLLILRGDANPQADSSHVRPGDVLGVARLLVPAIGLPALWVRAGAWVPLLALIAAMLALLLCSTLDRGRSRSGVEREDEDSAVRVLG